MSNLQSNNILVVCWDFPPNDGIGGRRWAKFAKLMVDQGCKVVVIKSNASIGSKISPWLKDVQEKVTDVYDIKSHWAASWLHDYRSKLKSLKIRIAKLYLSFIENGTIYDRAVGIERTYMDLLIKVVSEHKINRIIVTGAPFNLLYYTAKARSFFPNIKLIADYRDPWINSVNYGMPMLSNKRKEAELNKQNILFKSANTITAPNEFLIEQIKIYNKTNKVNFKVLEHFYDPDDVVSKVNTKRTGGLIKIVYAGALYSHTNEYLKLLESAMEVVHQETDVRIQLDIYSIHRTDVFRPENINKSVFFHENVGDKIFELLAEYDFIMILLSHHNKDFKTTKYYEYMPYKIPFLYIGPEGHVSESIVQDQIGQCVFEKDDLVKICMNYDSTQYNFGSIEKYALKNKWSTLKEILEAK